MTGERAIGKVASVKMKISMIDGLRSAFHWSVRAVILSRAFLLLLAESREAINETGPYSLITEGDLGPDEYNLRSS